MIDVTGMPQTAVVLGANSDLASAVLRRLAERRVSAVLLAGRDVDALNILAGDLRARGIDTVEVVRFDACEVTQHEALVDQAIKALGEIDLVLTAVGVLGTSELDELDSTTTANLIDSNFTGPASATLAFAKALKKQGRGQLVVFSSAAAMRVRRSNFLYGAAKLGFDGFCQGLADALVGSGVRLMIVRPGFVPTKMTAGMRAQPFSADVDGVADAVLHGLERQREVVWVPAILAGVAIIARAIPRALWRRLPI